MLRLNALTRGLPLAACAAMTVAAPAQAAVTIGETQPLANNVCPPSSIHLQAASAGSSYVVPSAGVITSWSNAPIGPAARVRLKIFRATAVLNAYTVVDQSRIETTSASAFSTRIPVLAGDILGLTSIDASTCVRFGTSAADKENAALGQPDPSPGTTFTPPVISGTTRVNVSANLEPDADGDGFGDETQDGCSTNPKRQDDCVAPTVTLTRVGKPKAKTTFTLVASETGVTFQCALDGPKFKNCGATKVF
ncbi:MAG: hypothetical protein QOG62_2083, partial [Thermoleophilaceae bacterium]|nr:hypothetical protein [Thermoleophilaceae bacterium]